MVLNGDWDVNGFIIEEFNKVNYFFSYEGTEDLTVNSPLRKKKAMEKLKIRKEQQNIEEDLAKSIILAQTQAFFLGVLL